MQIDKLVSKKIVKELKSIAKRMEASLKGATRKIQIVTRIIERKGLKDSISPSKKLIDAISEDLGEKSE